MILSARFTWGYVGMHFYYFIILLMASQQDITC